MTIETLSWNQVPNPACRGGAVTIGNFDGVHRGHAQLLTELRRLAGTVGGPAVALTFDPHPLQLLRPQQFQPLLTTAEDRAQLLRQAGADHVVTLRTTHDLLQLRAVDFFRQVLLERLAARAMVEGTNFGFGRDREGDVQTLGALCREHGLELVIVPPVQMEGKPVSSSRVRQALLRGAVQEAARMLDRPYRLTGVVGVGERRGTLLGFPTANLSEVATLVPGDGVYAVRVEHAGRPWAGAASIGPNPTFGEQVRKVEVHLIDFTGDLYDQPLAVDFLERLRDVRPFAGAPQLVEQLRRDVDAARTLVGPL